MTKLSASLWKKNADLARANLDCAFVRGIADGTLPRDTFRGYVAQDAWFLEGFARAYAVALSRARDRETLFAFEALLHGVVEELNLHKAYAKRWDVKLKGVKPMAATSAYVDFLLATTATGSVGEICSAMTPCMRLYAYLGRTLAARQGRKAHKYSEWIQTYSSDAFEELAQTLEGLLDKSGVDSAVAARNYRRAMELELAFFNAHA